MQINKYFCLISSVFFLTVVSAQAPISGSTIGSSAYGLFYNLLMAFVALLGLAILFFGTRFGFAAYKKRKNFKVTANIYNPDGTFFTKRIGKFRTKDNIDKMLFQGSSETMPVIDPRYIRANKVTLWRYGPGQYAVIPPRVWECMDPKKWNIDVINMQMKNFAFLEQRAAVSRWAYIKDLLSRWAPYLTMVLMLIFAGVCVWFMMKTGYSIFGDAVKARTEDCMRLIGGASAPVPTAAG